ncbi:MAG: O-antigen ligase domain-containing protein, partial [Verrucomicrobiales bacterium]
MKLFQKLPHHRATIISLILAWMFLPEYAYRFPGLPDYSKTAAASIAVLIATFAYAGDRFDQIKLELHDLVMVVWCFTPMLASIDNGLGLYDGVSATKNYVTTWFAPYLVGRLYVRDWTVMRDLAWAIFFGGLIYTPLAAYEIVMSPQLHNKIYGWHPHDFIQSVRGNTFRPVIFM